MCFLLFPPCFCSYPLIHPHSWLFLLDGNPFHLNIMDMGIISHLLTDTEDASETDMLKYDGEYMEIKEQ